MDVEFLMRVGIPQISLAPAVLTKVGPSESSGDDVLSSPPVRRRYSRSTAQIK